MVDQTREQAITVLQNSSQYMKLDMQSNQPCGSLMVDHLGANHDFIQAIHTLFDDDDRVEIYTDDHLARAREHGRPFLPVLTPARDHDGNKKITLQEIGEELEAMEIMIGPKEELHVSRALLKRANPSSEQER